MTDEWEHLAGWWADEARSDAVFGTDVAPFTLSLIDGAGSGPDAESGGDPFRRRSGTDDVPWLDLGCGEGRMLRRMTRPVIGCDISHDLARLGASAAPVVRCRLPDLAWIRPGTLAGAYAVLTVEHIADLSALFESVRRVVRPEGSLVVVSNHPSFTADGSGPIIDLSDGEVLWRWGPYFETGAVPTILDGTRSVTFHHRPLGAILTTAAEAGWRLERCEERPLSTDAIAAHPGYQGQEFVPRLVGIRWRTG